MAMISLPIAFSRAIGVFAPVLSRPVWQHVKVLMTGAGLAPGKRTVTTILQVMGHRTSTRGSDHRQRHLPRSRARNGPCPCMHKGDIPGWHKPSPESARVEDAVRAYLGAVSHHGRETLSGVWRCNFSPCSAQCLT